MKKLLQKRLNNEKGLTLVELLAVIVILGIIAAIAIPSIGNIIQNTREKAVVADAQNALAAANLYFTENNGETSVLIKGTGTDVKSLEASGFIKDAGSLIDGTVDIAADGKVTITTTGKAGKNTVTITAKTNKELSESGKAAYSIAPTS